MTHFPSSSGSRSAAKPLGGKQALTRDVLWGRPVFKAPQLPNPRTAFDPLPFTATRVTQRAQSRPASA